MPALLVAHRRPGFYLRVLEEGEVSAGDEIVKVAAGPERMTVAEVDGLLYLPGPRATTLARALRIPALSPGWRASFAAILDAAPTPGGGNAGLVDAARRPPGRASARCGVTAHRGRRAARVTSLSAGAAPTAPPAPPALPGQFVTVRLPSATPRRRRCCAATRCRARRATPRYRISVKREPDGAASGYIHDQVRIGDMVDVAAPRGNFTLRPGHGAGAPGQRRGRRHAGAGHAARAGRPTRSDAGGLVAARRAQRGRAALRGRGRRAARRGCRTPTAHVCLQPPRPRRPAGPRLRQRGAAVGAGARPLCDLPPDADAYLCGPPASCTTSPPRWSRSGWIPPDVHTEIFGARRRDHAGDRGVRRAPPHPPPADPGHGPSVAFARSGLTVSWHPDYASLLELAEACDVPDPLVVPQRRLPHVRDARCCPAAVAYYPDPVEPPAVGNVLICSARPTGPVALDL